MGLEEGEGTVSEVDRTRMTRTDADEENLFLSVPIRVIRVLSVGRLRMPTQRGSPGWKSNTPLAGTGSVLTSSFRSPSTPVIVPRGLHRSTLTGRGV